LGSPTDSSSLNLSKNVDIFQTSNLDAKEFYVANGFVETEVIKDYYKRIDPPGNYIYI
jgi:ribosomal protein S18 acetylase RimI-like enzyme